MKRIGTGLLVVGAITALVPQMMLPLTVYSVVYRLFSFALFPAASAIAFTSTLLAFLLFYKAHLPTERAQLVVVLLGVNLAVSALFLAPDLLNAGCAGSTSPRPCGYGPSVCGINLLTGIAAAIIAWRAIREVRRFPSVNAPHI